MNKPGIQADKAIIKYNPQFDGLRCFAVLFVLLYHWVPPVTGIEVNSFWGGAINFFFVLSSFLITMVLFSAQHKGAAIGVSRFKVMMVFLLRRTIRIFPAYYFFLLLVLLIPVIGNEAREHSFMYFSYLANYRIYESHEFNAALAHIWTLGVEEQLYLLWPLLILFVPGKHLLKTLLLMIVCSVAARAIFYHDTVVVPQAILTQYCVDAFAVGAILAYKKLHATEKEKIFITRLFNMAIFIGIPAAAVIFYTKSAYYSFVFNRLLFAVVSMKLIEGAVFGYKNIVGKILESKPVVFFGRISYGIYLYHLLMPLVFWKMYDTVMKYGRNHYTSFFEKNYSNIASFEKFISSGVVCLIIYFVLVIAAALLSAKFIEQPMNKLKVPYSFKFKKISFGPFHQKLHPPRNYKG